MQRSKVVLPQPDGPSRHTSYAVQYMEQFSTEPKGEAGDGDLFSEE